MPLTSQITVTRILLRAAVSAAVILTALLVAAGTASAHADVVSSSPAQGTLLTAEPSQVILDYSEAVTLRLSSISVIAPDGRKVAAGAPSYGATGEDSLAVALAPDASEGTYVVDWQATAADDGHATSGFVTFSVGAPSRIAAPAQSATRDTATDTLVDIALWLGFAGLALMVGDTAIRLMARTPSLAGRWIAPLGWAVTLVATLLQLLLAGPYARGEAPTHVFDRSLLSAELATPEGHALMARLVLLAVAAAFGTALRISVSGVWFSAVLTIALAVTWSMTSHAASGSQVPLALTVTAVHVTSMAVWVGGLASLAVMLSRGGDGAPADPAQLCRRFSRLALLAVAALAASGLYQAWREVGAISALTGTGYGRLLIVKVLVVAGVLTVAARSRSLLRGRFADRPDSLRTAIVIELGGAAAVLIVTVLLLAADPARTAAALAAAH
ncbi:copper resistance CopC/CopD family protein [Actinospica robiniae]|uniref:copper resistance CopC/CopD family protein n=1 Tax=Actinospica robiniae TaxID=304901 RepID=UPI000401394D|nr:copper resistance protein CopC [Actinospica robiniae]